MFGCLRPSLQAHVRVVLVVVLVGVSQCTGTQLTQLAFRDGFQSPYAMTWFSMHFYLLLGLPMAIVVATSPGPPPRSITSSDRTASTRDTQDTDEVSEPLLLNKDNAPGTHVVISEKTATPAAGDPPNGASHVVRGQVDGEGTKADATALSRATSLYPTTSDHPTTSGAFITTGIDSVSLLELSPAAALRTVVTRFHASMPRWRYRGPQLLLFYVLALVANIAYVVALKHMSASVVSATFAAAPAFVCILSLIILNRKHRWAEDLAAVAAASGVVLAVHPWNADHGEYAFVSVAALAPIAAALYKVSFARVFTDVGFTGVGSILAQLGVINATVGTAALVAFCASSNSDKNAGDGWSQMWGGTPWLALVGSCAATVVFNLAVNYGVTITAPLYVSVGSILSTVLNIGVDSAVLGSPPSAIEWGGMAVIFLSFGVLLWSHLSDRRTVEDVDIPPDPAEVSGTEGGDGPA